MEEGQANETLEQECVCPFCGEPVTVLLDLSVEEQSFIEDCEVCCRPMNVAYSVEANAVTSFDVTRGD